MSGLHGFPSTEMTTLCTAPLQSIVARIAQLSLSKIASTMRPFGLGFSVLTVTSSPNKAQAILAKFSIVFVWLR